MGLLVGGASALVFVLLGSSGSVFVDTLPEYRTQFERDDGPGLRLAAGPRAWSWTRTPSAGCWTRGVRSSFFGGFLTGIGGTLSNLLLIVFAVIFMLADAPTFPTKVALSEGARGARTLRLLQAWS